MRYDYDWDWDWMFVQHFARKMRDLKYSPWYVASNLAEVFKFLQEQEEEKQKPEENP